MGFFTELKSHIVLLVKTILSDVPIIHTNPIKERLIKRPLSYHKMINLVTNNVQIDSHTVIVPKQVTYATNNVQVDSPTVIVPKQVTDNDQSNLHTSMVIVSKQLERPILMQILNNAIPLLYISKVYIMKSRIQQPKLILSNKYIKKK
jgi:hypothetical protein